MIFWIDKSKSTTLWSETIIIKVAVTPTDLILYEVVVLSSDEVVVALNTNKYEPSYKDEDEIGLEEDGHILIY